MTTTTSRITLEVSGQSHVPSFKNSKLLITQNRGRRLPRPLLITKPEYKKWMEACVELFVSQLRLEFQTRGIAIRTGPQALCLIASSLPLDDSFKWIGEMCVKPHRVSKGSEGATITIERIA
jgi:hypothetical protein